MVCVWVAGKTVIPLLHTAISERFEVVVPADSDSSSYLRHHFDDKIWRRSSAETEVACRLELVAGSSAATAPSTSCPVQPENGLCPLPFLPVQPAYFAAVADELV